jgi:tetratricopeptide (TPR) repeat protein
LNNLGLAHSKREQYTEAVDCFQRAMRRKPNYTDPHLNLGVTYKEMKLPEKAELQLRAAVALAPLNIYARNQLGTLYFEADRLGEAEEQLLRSAESEPNVIAYNRLGDIYLRRKDSSRAERAFEHAAAIDPFDSHARFNLGALFMVKGRKAEALREYQAGLQTDPRNAEARAIVEKLRTEASNADPSKP